MRGEHFTEGRDPYPGDPEPNRREVLVQINLTRLLRWLRLLCSTAGLLYAVSLLAVIFGMRWVGERNVTTAYLLFLPPLVWLTPAPVALLATALARSRTFFLILAACLLFPFIPMGWQFGPGNRIPLGGLKPRKSFEVSGLLSVMTYNRGQHLNQSLQPFIRQTKPHLIAMQEAAGRAAGYLAAPEYGHYGYAENEGEFLLLSHYPITAREALEYTGSGSRPTQFAVRFQIRAAGTDIAVYNVHLPSPRDTLYYYTRGAALYGVLGLIPGTPFSQRRQELQEFWNHRMAMIDQLLERAEAETMPVILLGDFNSPQSGHIFQVVSDHFQDSHQKAGSGFGFSFPGVTRNPLSLRQPWMRIDYIFANDDWGIVQSIAEPDRPSQHRAVAALLHLKSIN